MSGLKTDWRYPKENINKKKLDYKMKKKKSHLKSESIKINYDDYLNL